MGKDENLSQDHIRQEVREGYAKIAGNNSGCCGPEISADELARGIGYLRDDLADIPEDSNMGLSCGNPTALAQLKSGEIVLDLGSGGGFDVFIAARNIGPSGRAIGVDMTPEMLSKARRATAVFTEKTGLRNVEFRLGEIEHLPVADASIDVVISNCVINLSPDKPQVWREIFRVLKPGGRACVSDLALTRELPQQVRDSVSALVGCISGAVLLDETTRMIAEAGLTEPQISIKKFNMDIMDNCNDTLYQTVRQHLPDGARLGDYVVSADITAYKET
ncbi:MAG TPA: arsenite methyltransferase [Sedimentisphaerales bacterium]|nr:arsenite methyltransferase [Sedimentisphaerales bacterium]